MARILYTTASPSHLRSLQITFYEVEHCLGQQGTEFCSPPLTDKLSALELFDETLRAIQHIPFATVKLFHGNAKGYRACIRQALVEGKR